MSDLRRMTAAVLTALLAFASSHSSVSAQVLDKLVAVIDNSFIITLSDIRKERAVQGALGAAAAATATDDEILSALIERQLIEVQLAQFRTIEIDATAIDARLRAVTPPSGVSIAELRDAIAGEMRRFEFLVQRFRQFIQASDEEARMYFEQVVVPELRSKGAPIPPLQEGIEMARPNVIAEKMNQEVDDWLKELRRRSNVEKITY